MEIESTNYETYSANVSVTAQPKGLQNNFRFAEATRTATYGDALFTMTATGNVSGSNVTYESDAPGVATVNRTTGEVTIVGQGEATITATASETTNYYSKTASYTLAVGRAGLIITAVNQSIYSGATLPDMEYTVSGLVGDDTLTSAGITFTMLYEKNGETVASPSAIGAYDIVFNGSNTIGNYNITYVPGTLTIANWPFNGNSTYTVATTDTAENGSVTVSTRNASEGTTVTIIVTPDEGYTLETLTVLDQNGNVLELKDLGNGRYSFKMPVGKVDVKATFMDDNSMLNFFVDVTADEYYYDAVLWAAKNGITGGVDETHFAPYSPCTRAQIVTFLWRAAGSPEPTALTSFADVSASAYYAKAVAWAVENGITSGVGDNRFAPDQICTRADAVAFLFNGMDAVTLQELVSGYGDAESVPGYAIPAFNWALACGIVKGYAGNLMPKANCAHAQIVEMLYRLLGK